MLDAWDPIGVYESEAGPPPGEYERLVGPVLSRLHRGDGADAIAEFLTQDVRTNMGLPGRAASDLDTARWMHAWFHERTR